MRGDKLRALIAEMKEEEPVIQARALMIERFGPRVAAWLINRHRAGFVRAGAVDFALPRTMPEATREALAWFFLAIDFLRGRAGWSVMVDAEDTHRVFRVRWLGWPHRGSSVEITLPRVHEAAS